MSERRWAVLLVTPELLVDMCKLPDSVQQIRVVANQLPADARLAGAGRYDFDAGRGMLSIIVESETFPPIKEGNVLPILPAPLFEQVRS